MNRYYYVSVLDNGITCNGDSLSDILRIADSELFSKCLHEKDKSKIENSFRDKSLPHKIVVVSNGSFSYELVTQSFVGISSMDDIAQCELSGEQVVDIFMDNPNYSDTVFNLMEKYNKRRIVNGGYSKIKK